jgi:hypothetical protein
VSFSHLLRLEERYGLDHRFDPEDAARSYTVGELLEGVRHESAGPGPGDDRSQRYRIEARGNARVTVVAGDVHGGGGQVQVGQSATGHGSAGGSPTASWRWLSVACGIGAVVIAIVLWLLPSSEWRLIVGGLLGLGVVVTAVMLWLNPAFFYRRLLAAALLGGLLANALGSGSVLVASEQAAGWVQWDGAVSWSSFVAWGAAVVALVWGDLRQGRG